MMKETDIPSDDQLTSTELAHKQAIKYGRDLARIYVAERAKREELQVAYQQLQAIFANTPAGLLVLDTEYRIRQANQLFYSWVECDPEQAEGQVIEKVLAAESLIPTLEAMRQGQAVANPADLLVTKPIQRAFSAHIAPFESRQTSGWIVVLQDQSERRRLAFQKAEFVNVAAHELRTPMAPILGYSLILLEDLEGQIDPMQFEFIEAIHQGATRLQKRIDELITFANLNRGQVWSHETTTFKLDPLVKQVVDELREAAAEKEIVLEMDSIDPDLTLHTDAASLQVALQQIVANAIKFNRPGGHVSITGQVSPDIVKIQVTDTGIGIPQAELDAIFKPFFQVEDHRTRHMGGLGMGLPMAQRAVSRFGGVIDVETKLGAGSTFSISVPAHKPQVTNITAPETAVGDDQHLSALPLNTQVRAALNAIIKTMENREAFAPQHTENVMDLAVRIAHQMNYPAGDIATLRLAARLHDIGKLGIPDAILGKQEQLSRKEQIIYQQHVLFSEQILAPLEGLQPAMLLITGQQERWDGRGFPQGLAGEAIPLGARILALADAYDHLMQQAAIREDRSAQSVLADIQAEAGTRWDPNVVDALVAVLAQKTAA